MTKLDLGPGYPESVDGLPYRPCVGVMVLNRDGLVWAGRRIAEAFPATEKMSSRQRLGMVEDMWEMALARLHGAPPPERESCCLLYALPGCAPCAGCPRQG